MRLIAIKVNTHISNFKVNAELENYPVIAGNNIKTGDLLKFIDLNNKTYVTNQLLIDDHVEGIARFGNINSEIIPVYILTYRARYRDLVYPYESLQQFTYDELRTMLISHVINNSFTN